MRSTRTLIAGAVLGTALTLGAPAAAFADASDSGSSGYSQNSGGSEEWGSKKEEESKGKEGGWSGHKKPHGGMHTGGGGMALNGNGGMTAGALLLVGGLGAGAYVLRRRTPEGKAV